MANGTNLSVDSGASEDLPARSMTPAKEGGEWDGADAPVRNSVEELESQAFDDDQDARDRDAAKDFDEESPAEEDATNEDGDREVPEEETARADAEEDIDPALSPRANERIRQLNAQRRSADDRAAKLEAQISSLLEVQTRQAQMQERSYQEAAFKREADLADTRRKAFIDQLKEVGFDDTNVAHLLSLDALEKARATEDITRRAIQQRDEREREQAYQAYENALRSELLKTVTDPKTGKVFVSNEVQSALFDQTYAVARIQQIRSPSEAVQKVVAPLLAQLRATEKRSTKRPDSTDPVHKVISTSGRAAGRSPGTRASGKKPLARDVQAFLK